MNQDKLQSVYEELRKLYQAAPEGTFARYCLQLACRCVQMAGRPKSMQKVKE